MNILNSLIKYICVVYPHSHELSNARLTKLIYLTDWESVRITGSQVTSIKWYFDNYGPFVRDVYDVAYIDPNISIVETQTIYGTPKIIFQYLGEKPILDPHIRGIIDNVIRDTRGMYWNGFIEYVYSTPPIVKSNRYTYLDLVEFR
ncbi:Panacea domain-containing protein [Psychrobacter alimentarius]|uniref:Panacea domain-containing protein n=1 Tax=Psychrobacter TaxID=497 RepID=UPI000BAAE049|nr:Panacea domain-containing protein [Psychrobacter sp. JB193]PAT64658.1 hypothetical protein CIK80_06185 [Psychrobacter sp. JB193]